MANKKPAGQRKVRRDVFLKQAHVDYIVEVSDNQLSRWVCKVVEEKMERIKAQQVINEEDKEKSK